MSDAHGQLTVVHVDTGTELRGGQQQLLLLARGLRRRGHRQTIVCPEGSRLESRGREEGFPVFTLPYHDPGCAHGILQLRQQFQIAPLQIVHAHDGRGQAVAWLASLGKAVRRVASRRVTYLPARRSTHRFIYQHTCQGVIAISQFVRQLLVSCGVPESKIEVIPDGVEMPAEWPRAETRARIRAQWGFGDQDFVAGHVGAFTPEKGQDIALDAAALLKERLSRFRLVLAGDGPTRNSAAIKKKLLRAGTCVRLLGYIENLTEFFPGLDLFIMPSRSEGLGSSALLAMAHGLAVVASRAGGLVEVVEEGKTGWLVPADSPPAFAEAIAEAASERETLARMGENARGQARQFSADIMVERTENFYIRLVALESGTGGS